MTQLVLSLGSNIERDKHIRYAIRQLQLLLGELTLSPIYETEAVGFNGPDFYNLVVVSETDLTLDKIIQGIQKIECGAGRIRGKKSCESRTLDIDVLLYGDADYRDQGHNIPRDEIYHAAYVLKPLVDVLPNAHHPVSGERFKAIWMALAKDRPVLREIVFEMES